MNKKGATSISTLVMLVMTLTLCAVTAYSLLIGSAAIKRSISGIDVLQTLLLRESQQNYYLTFPGSGYASSVVTKENGFSVAGQDNKVQAIYDFNPKIKLKQIITQPQVEKIEFKADFERSMFNSKEEIYNDIFKFKDGTAAYDVFYKFFPEGWAWALIFADDYVSWTGVGKSIEPDSKRTAKDKEFIESLKGKNFELGLLLLLQRTINNKEGGWFSNTGLVYYYKGQSKTYSYNNPLLKNESLFIDDLNNFIAAIDKKV